MIYIKKKNIQINKRENKKNLEIDRNFKYNIIDTIRKILIR
jgi:tRNA U34 5-carboxymethylaminomethyl modifying enzyme MnmG/GidA